MSDVKRWHYNAQSGLLYDAWALSVSEDFVRASDYDRLQSALAAAEAKLDEPDRNPINAAALAECRRVCKEIMGGHLAFVDDDVARALLTVKERAEAQLTAAQARIAELELELASYELHHTDKDGLLLFIKRYTEAEISRAKDRAEAILFKWHTGSPDTARAPQQDGGGE
jgi:hypothetical protein